jgi:hypothetical protein
MKSSIFMAENVYSISAIFPSETKGFSIIELMILPEKAAQKR